MSNQKKPIMNCTADTPMPKERDYAGATWYHHGSKPAPGQVMPEKVGDTSIYKCPNCALEFRVTLRGPVTTGEAIRLAADAKNRGLRRP